MRRYVPRRVFVVSAAGAALAASPARAADAPSEVTIAMQPGIGYANLIVMKQQGLLEKHFPQTKFNWLVFANGDAIRDGIISKQIQIGAGGIGPFLIGWDRGVGYKLIGALNQMNLWLVVRNPKYRTLKDFGPGTKIGMPSPDAIQAVALRMAAQQQLGNAHALDANIVAIEHPLGLVALANGQLDGHLTSPPFQQQEVDAGGRAIFRTWDASGRSTFNSVYTTDAFFNDYPIFIRTFYSELARATDFINKNVDGTSDLLSRDTGRKVAAADFRKWLRQPDIEYSIVPHAFGKFAKFMKDIGMLNKVPGSMRDLELAMLQGVGD